MDLTEEIDVVAYMSSAKGQRQWNMRCRNVRKANSGRYPTFWTKSVAASLVMLMADPSNFPFAPVKVGEDGE